MGLTSYCRLLLAPAFLLISPLAPLLISLRGQLLRTSYRWPHPSHRTHRPPLASSIESPIEKDASASWPFYHLERPQIIYFQDKYHLFFSCFKEFVNPTWLKTIGAEKVTDSTLYWFVSDSVTGPFEPSSSLPVVPGSEATGLYGTTFSPLPMVDDWTEMSALGKANGEVHLTVLGWYHQDYTLAIAGEFRAIWNASGLKIIGS